MRLRDLYIFEAPISSGQEVRAIRFSELPSRARDSYRNAFIKYHENSAQQLDNWVAENPGEAAVSAITSMAQEHREIADEMTATEKSFDAPVEEYPYYTDGEVVAAFMFNDDIVTVSDAESGRDYSDATHIYFWDGNRWYGDDEYITDFGSLTSEMRATALAMVSNLEKRKNPRWAAVSDSEREKAEKDCMGSMAQKTWQKKKKDDGAN